MAHFLLDRKQAPCHISRVAALIGNLRDIRATVRTHQASGALDRGNIEWRADSFAERALGRVRPGNVIVVGGRTNSGKSLFSLALQVDNLGRSLYLSLEDDEVEISRRAEAMADEDAERITLAIPAEFTSSHIMKVTAAVAKQDSWPLYEGCKLVVLDYIQLLSYSGTLPALSRTEAVAHIIADLRRHGREHGYALCLNAQITRPPKASAPGPRRIEAEDEEPPEQAPPRPTLFDLKDSSSIENAATMVLLVHGRTTWCDVTCVKHKSSPTGERQRYARTENGWLAEI